MAGAKDKVVGSIKEHAGKVTGDESLERRGKLQHAKGDAKEKLDDVTTKARRAVKGDI